MSGPLKWVIDLDAPGAGNWQGIARNAKTGEWFVAHSQGRFDKFEDTHFYRFTATGKYVDKMTLVKGGHVLGFGVSDTNIIWTTYNDDTGNDVVTVRYQPGEHLSKADCQQMHVFTDNPAQVSFSPTRTNLAVYSRAGNRDTWRLYRKQDVLDNQDTQISETITAPRKSGRVLQGFAPVNRFLYVLLGLDIDAARIEKWSFDTGEMVGAWPVGGYVLNKGEEGTHVEPEGMDGRYVGMKVGRDSARRMRVFEHSY